MKNVLITILVLLFIVGLVFTGRWLILGRAKVVMLKNDPISSVISKSLQTPSTKYLPIAGKDYTVTHIQYFKNKQWAVVSVSPMGTFSDAAMIVFEQKSGGYTTVLGPGSSFQSSNLNGLPSDVAKYVKP